MNTRALTPVHRLLIDTQKALETVFGSPTAQGANPAGGEADVVVEDGERRHLEVDLGNRR